MEANYFPILYWFCHTLTWIRRWYTCVPHPESPSHLPPHTIPLGYPSAPALSILYHASNLDWQFISHKIIYMFQCHSPKSSHPHPLPQNPKDCAIHLCLFAVSHTGLSLPSFYICYLETNLMNSKRMRYLTHLSICVIILYWCFSFWLISLWIIGSSFIHLIRTDSNVFFLMAE